MRGRLRGSTGRAARAESETNAALILREQRPFKWRVRLWRTPPTLYVFSSARSNTFATTIPSLKDRRGTLRPDNRSLLTWNAESNAKSSQTARIRVVAVLGILACEDERLDSGHARGLVGRTRNLLVQKGTRGISWSIRIGGGSDVNVFSQERRLNRG